MLNKLRKWLGLHVWRYRNPFDRTCEVCGRNEVAHEFYGDPHDVRWVVFDDGVVSKHKKGGTA